MEKTEENKKRVERIASQALSGILANPSVDFRKERVAWECKEYNRKEAYSIMSYGAYLFAEALVEIIDEQFAEEEVSHE